MATVSTELPPAPAHAAHGHPPARKRGNVLIRPGWWRALIWTAISGVIAIAVPAFIRVLLGWHWYESGVMWTSLMFVMPMGFVIGIGCFDYWGRYIIGSPTRPEDHSDH